jgi:hypothetical protein
MTRDPDPPNLALHSITPDCLNLIRIPPFSHHRQDGFRVEIRWSNVRYPLIEFPVTSCEPPLTIVDFSSYNRYLAVASRAVRRSLKDGPRLAAERRGNMELRFAKWEVRIPRLDSSWVPM